MSIRVYLLRFLYSFTFVVLLSCILTSEKPMASFVPVSPSHSLSLPAHLAQTGDLIFRRADGAGSQFVDTLDQQSSFSHVGMIYVASDGGAFVIHVLPQDPDIVQLEPLNTFLQDAVVVAVYRPIEEIADEAIFATEKALVWVGEKQFDRDFDLRTDETLYCTELVYKAYQEAGIDIVHGDFNIVDFPFLEVKEVIYPSLIIENDLFMLMYFDNVRLRRSI